MKDLRKCNVCKNKKKFDCFSKDKRSPIGLSYVCKDCRKIVMKKYRSTDRGHIKDLWHNIKNRCYSDKHKSYPIYGGRGIKICDEWLGSFDIFYNWCMSQDNFNRNLELDRINNDDGYNPSNCRFITRRENSRRKDQNKLSVETASIARHLKEVGFKAKSIANFFNISPCYINNMLNKNQSAYYAWRSEEWLKDNPIPKRIRKRKYH